MEEIRLIRRVVIQFFLFKKKYLEDWNEIRFGFFFEGFLICVGVKEADCGLYVNYS